MNQDNDMEFKTALFHTLATEIGKVLFRELHLFLSKSSKLFFF